MHLQRKRKRHDPDLTALEPKRSLGQILGKCDEEDVESSGITPLPEQPLYVDKMDDKIKCRWCPNWIGSAESHVINQHVWKAASHKTALCKELQAQKGKGVQMDIRTFFSLNHEVIELQYSNTVLQSHILLLL